MDFGAFVTGAATQGTEDLSRRRETRLALMLKNAQIVAEREAARYSPEVSSYLADRVGAKLQPDQRLYDVEGTALAGLARTDTSAAARTTGRGSGMDGPVSPALARVFQKTYGFSPEGMTNRDIARATTMMGAKPEEITSVSEFTSSLRNLPELKTTLAAVAQKNGDLVRRFAQSGNWAAVYALPEVQQALSQVVTPYLAAKGGKVLTKNEEARYGKMVASYLYDQKTQDEAFKDFGEMVGNSLRGRINSGKLGLAREELAGELNEAMIKNGMSPIMLNPLQKLMKPDAAKKDKATQAADIRAAMREAGLIRE